MGAHFEQRAAECHRFLRAFAAFEFQIEAGSENQRAGAASASDVAKKRPCEQHGAPF